MIRRLAFVVVLVLAIAAPALGQPASGPWSRVLFTAGPIITAGAGSPEGVVTATTGSVYLQTDGTAGLVLWTKVGTGATGWSTGGGGGGLSTHTVLGPYHSDSASAGPVRGAVIAGNAAPVWARVLPGPAGSVLRYSGTDTTFSTDGTGLTVDASKATIGTLPASAFPALTGDVTTSAGSLTTTIAANAITSPKIANGAVLFADWNLNGCTAGQLAHINAGGTAWECSDPVAGGGTPHALLSSTHPDTNAATAIPGDVLYANAGGLWTRLPVGTNGQILTLAAGFPTWTAPPAAAVCQSGEFNAGSSGAAIGLNWNSGASQIVTLTNNTTLTLSNPVAGCTYRIEFVQNATGGWVVTFPSSLKFENDTAPTLVTTPNKVIFCSLVYTTIGADGYLGWCTTNPLSQP